MNMKLMMHDYGKKLLILTIGDIVYDVAEMNGKWILSPGESLRHGDIIPMDLHPLVTLEI